MGLAFHSPQLLRSTLAGQPPGVYRIQDIATFTSFARNDTLIQAPTGGRRF
ncbi:MAG: hypothetical protein GQ562_09320 [Anaerolineales bacterium]|nr:hypothetical protein [Anaerolineales bacterium]